MERPIKCLVMGIYDTEVCFAGIDLEPIKESILVHA